ncbi:tyrosine-type recombinase/integrase [Paenibacillus lentus]|uniref:tyrosine-type recombinase/integrase n=1 Tax=Paenibacillus lentus TaxID=1338368 RepID=UPI001FE2EAC5|nr:site-specific integrase [Paenibacillus lentus]
MTKFYYYQQKRISEGTALSYLKALERFFSWLSISSNYQGVRVKWSDNHLAVRAAIEDYLIYKLGCKLRSKEDFQLVIMTRKSPQTINHFLAAIKSFYKTALHLKLYTFQNPLIDAEYNIKIGNKTSLSMRENKPRLPKIAGTEIPSSPSYRKYSDSYFKLVATEWKPSIIADQDLPYIIYRAGSQIGWSLRDEVIIRMLFETGARVSEILELTLGDYRQRINQYEIATHNKGSEKKRTKFLRFSQDLLKLLIRYVNGERKTHAYNKQTFTKLSDNELIFLTRNGDPYNYRTFYYHWIKITEQAKIKMNIHKTRHWFVTSMIRSIYETASDSSQIEMKKKELINYIKWKDPETIKVYEHYFDEAAFRETHEIMAKQMQKYEQEYLSGSLNHGVHNKVANTSLPTEEIEWINEFYKGME